jgi:hypothetical protein
LYFRSILIIESLYFFNPFIPIVMRNLKSTSYQVIKMQALFWILLAKRSDIHSRALIYTLI